MHNPTRSTIRRPGYPACGAALAAAACFLAAGVSAACPIPVFQYSLEHWEADPYVLTVHHNGPLDAAQQAVLDKLRKIDAAEGSVANIQLVLRDHALSDAGVSTPRPLPYIEVRYPAVSGIRNPLLHAELTESGVAALLDSPLRRLIAEHLLQRKSAVWVLLESGRRQEDRAALRTLEREIPRLENILKVPDPTDEFGVDLGDIHTEIEFSIVRLRRDDPREQALVAMLLGIEPDLKDFDDKPLVFPVYGRGLVLYGLVGAGINPQTLAAAGEFLVGPCSCQVKQGNPGVDLLMSVDWAGQVEPRSRPSVPETGTGGFIERLEQAEDKPID